MARKHYPLCEERIPGLELVALGPYDQNESAHRFDQAYGPIIPVLDRCWWLLYRDQLNNLSSLADQSTRRRIEALPTLGDDMTALRPGELGHEMIALPPGELASVAAAPPGDEEHSLELWGYAEEPEDLEAATRNLIAWPRTHTQTLYAYISEDEIGKFFFCRDPGAVESLELHLRASPAWSTRRTTLSNAWDTLESYMCARDQSHATPPFEEFLRRRGGYRSGTP